MARNSGGGFVQADLSPTETPSTVASPIDTYQQQATAKTSASPGSQFLEGLGKLAAPAATAISNYDQQAGDEAEAQAKVASLTAKPEDLRAEIASGNYFGLAHRRAQSALRVMDASNRVFEASSELDGMKQRGELAGPEAEAKVKLIVGAHAESVAGDPLAQKQFAAGMMPVMRKYTTDVYQANVQNEETNKSAKLYQYMVGLHGQVDQDNPNATPEQLAEAHKAALFKTADYAKNNLLMSPKAVGDTVWKVAEHYANSGNQPALAAIGRYDRDGSPISDQNGPQWDAWTKKAEAVADSNKKKAANSMADSLSAEAIKGSMPATDFNSTVDKAVEAYPENFGRARGEQLKAQFANGIATRQKAAVQALAAQQEEAAGRQYVEQGAASLMDGKGYMLPESTRFTAADGKERVFSTKDYRDRMYERGQAQIDDQGKREGWDADTLLRKKVQLYSRNGDVDPLFQRSFTDLFSGSKAGIPADPNTLPQRLGQLEFLRANDRGQYLNLSGKGSASDPKQATFLEAYSAARDYGSEPERAFSLASQRVFNPSSQDRLTGSDRQAKIDDVVKKWSEKGYFGTGVGAGLGVMPGLVAREKAAQAVDLSVAAGVANGDIVDRATERLAASHLVVNGFPVHNNIPGVGDAAVAAEYLSDGATYYKQSSPMLRNQPFNVAFADDPDRPGYYTVRRTDTGERITRPGAPDSSISGAKLLDFVMQWRERDWQKTKGAKVDHQRMIDAAPDAIEPEQPSTDAELAAAGERGARTRKAVVDFLTPKARTPGPVTVKDLSGD